MSADLFGQPLADDLPVSAGERKRKPTKPNGYAARPGSGPAGHTCGDCEHKQRVCGGSKVFSKCGLCERNWTHGPGSDIRVKSPACQFWVPVQKDPTRAVE